MNFNELIKKISMETFSDIIALSPRKVRESLFAHYNIKSKSRTTLAAIKEKKVQRIKQLYETLQNVKTPKELEFLKELFRNWLLHQRPLLKSTLDFLNIENDNGLIEVEPDFFKELSEKKVSLLIEHLTPNFSNDAILIYLAFMEVPHLEKHFS